MAETLCDSGAVKLKAGSNASSTITDNAVTMTQFINQAEGDIAADTTVDWVSKYSGLSANFKQVIEGAVASKAAISVINYNMGGFTSRAEALTMLNVNWATYDRAVRELKENKVKKDLFRVSTD